MATTDINRIGLAKCQTTLWFAILNGVIDPRLSYMKFFFPGTPVSSTNKTDRHDIYMEYR
jgi:hypothetical protein